jgi:nucleoside-diphosphate-sugar epimerase
MKAVITGGLGFLGMRAASIREMVECLQRAAEGRRLGPISWSPDPVSQAIVSSWPHDVDAARAIAARRSGP